MPQPPARDDPLPASRFLVEIAGVTVASFCEATGLAFETAVLKYRTGRPDARKLPGLHRVGQVVLKPASLATASSGTGGRRSSTATCSPGTSRSSSSTRAGRKSRRDLGERPAASVAFRFEQEFRASEARRR